jgi:hypothetical protein
MRHLPALASVLTAFVASLATPLAMALPVVFESAGADPAAIVATRDAFRAAIGGGTVAGANGSFGGLRREINWDGVPGSFSDPNALPADFFNVNSARGVVFSTPGSGFMVSANAGGATPVLFGFGTDFQAFSAQKLFTAVNSNITDVNFFLAGTATEATTSAFGLVFTDVEVVGVTKVQFFDADDHLIFSRDALVAGNQGLSFLGVTFDTAAIGRVRITSGANTIVSNGVLGNPVDDVVVMDDFLYAEPTISAAVPEPETYALMGIGLVALALAGRRRAAARSSRQDA